jgi:predicted lipoprotein
MMHSDQQLHILLTESLGPSGHKNRGERLAFLPDKHTGENDMQQTDVTRSAEKNIEDSD